MAGATSYEHGQFCWVDLVAHDMRAARACYEGLFGWTCRDLDTGGGPPYAQFEWNGQSVAGLGQMSAELKSQGIPPMWNSYINVESLEQIAARVESLGGQVTMPPMQVMDAGWMAFIQDPTGGHVGLWQKIEHAGAERFNEPGSFCWNELATRDVEAARQFYGELLGWTFRDNPHSPAKYYIIQVGEEPRGGIMQMDEQWGEMPPSWSVYFRVEDADATVRKLASLGGKTYVPPFDTPVGRIAVLADPQSACFNIIQLASEAPSL